MDDWKKKFFEEEVSERHKRTVFMQAREELNANKKSHGSLSFALRFAYAIGFVGILYFGFSFMQNKEVDKMPEFAENTVENESNQQQALALFNDEIFDQLLASPDLLEELDEIEDFEIIEQLDQLESWSDS